MTGARRIVGGVVEAGPARGRMTALAALALAGFAVMGVRAGALALEGALAGGQDTSPEPAATEAGYRADIVDRNGVLLASTVRGWTLVGRKADVWDPADAALRLKAIFPDLNPAEVAQRLTEPRDTIWLRRGLTDADRRAVLDAGIAGVGFEPALRRVYPQGALAGQVLGAVNAEGEAAGGLEWGLNARLTDAASLDRPVRLSLDMRLQFAVEEELSAATRTFGAQGGAVVLLDGRTGEVLALATNPALPAGRVRLDGPPDRAAQALYEMGSTLKPLTVALGLEAGLVTEASRFNTDAPLRIGTSILRDPHPRGPSVPLREALAHSSNIAAAEIALALGAERQTAGLRAFGLYDRALAELPASQAPLTPDPRGRYDVAARGFGHALSVSLVSVAGAYTTFVNDGERVAPTLMRRDPDAPIPRMRVVSPASARTTLQLMRAVVTDGTGQRADVPGLGLAGKTGTAEKPADAGYDTARNLSSFVAVFPVDAPRYVLAVALDEPEGDLSPGGLATGGATAAPFAARVAERIAPSLGLRLEPPRGASAAAAGR